MTLSCKKRPGAKTGTQAEREAYIKRCKAGKKAARTKKKACKKTTGKGKKMCGATRQDGGKCRSRILINGRCKNHPK